MENINKEIEGAKRKMVELHRKLSKSEEANQRKDNLLKEAQKQLHNKQAEKEEFHRQMRQLERENEQYLESIQTSRVQLEDERALRKEEQRQCRLEHIAQQDLRVRLKSINGRGIIDAGLNRP